MNIHRFESQLVLWNTFYQSINVLDNHQKPPQSNRSRDTTCSNWLNSNSVQHVIATKQYIARALACHTSASPPEIIANLN